MARRNAKRRGKPENTQPIKEIKKRSPFLIDVAAVLLMGFSLFAFVSFLLFQSKGLEASRWLGSYGVSLGAILERWLGVGSFALVLWGGVLSLSLLREGSFSVVRLRSFLALPFVLASLASLLSIASGFYSGGLLGVRIGGPLEDAMGKVGGIIASSVVLVVSLALSSGMGVTEFVGSSAKTSAKVGATSSNIIWRTFVTVIRTVLELIGLFAWIIKSVFSFSRRAASTETVWDKDIEEEPLPKPRRRKNTIPAEAEEKAEEIEDIPTHVVVKRRVNAVQALDKKKKAGKQLATEYSHPDIKLLTQGEPLQAHENDEELLAISKQIESKLRDFSIAGRVTEVHPGPVVTLFEFEPAPGVKVGRIAALQDDISMSLRATSIRIVAPIPRKGTVGIEVPNKHRDIVRLRDVLESDPVIHSDSILTVPIGKDTYGDPVAVDIANMPHLLIAGATGTGKSVCINAILLSLLYRSSPRDLGLILIDPKILELSVYEGIPHLRVPVVTVPRQAKAVLDWAAREMDRRYRLMQRFGVRSIDGYNRVVSGEESAKGESSNVIELAEHRVVAEGTVSKESPEDSEVLFQEELQPLPKIVIVIDELADLMLTVGREVEELITRLAQKARAAGIHLIVATQRPSVDVITGLIKANFPARLSFRVASRIDSRTILDSMGSEKLLGNGDMLFLQPGGGAPKRIHGAFVSDSEVKRVIEAVKRNGPPAYDERIIEVCEKALKDEGDGSGSGEFGSDEYDSVYDKAVELVVHKGQASTSMIQRAFRIGYNRAARIIEMMERDGIVGPMDGVKPREVLLAQSE